MWLDGVVRLFLLLKGSVVDSMIRNLIGKVFRYAKRSGAVERAATKNHGAELNEMMQKFADEIPSDGIDTQKQVEFSLEEVEQKAKEGEMEFQYQWGLILQHGREGVVERDQRTALKLFTESAKQGHPWARYNLANAHLTGVDNILKPNPEMSFKLFKLCTESKTDIPEAFAHVGNMYQHGLGTEKNEQKAIQYYHAAADMGDINSKAMLAKLALELQKRDVENDSVPENVDKEKVNAIKRQMIKNEMKEE